MLYIEAALSDLLQKLLGIDGAATATQIPAHQGIDLPADHSVSKMDNKIIINCGTPELEKASESSDSIGCILTQGRGSWTDKRA
ncbi:hypothetical protein OIU74_002478 [Salix koriyanagi]|uniref:Uncharacterized protein n=1 Tax=Salix koriyanagi TaxID=2511006 RepID=A0A9Q1AP69_9ROSI|nr:hypothetical protein OIU74_002478 [Salix koriyanagi]